MCLDAFGYVSMYLVDVTVPLSLPQKSKSADSIPDTTYHKCHHRWVPECSPLRVHNPNPNQLPTSLLQTDCIVTTAEHVLIVSCCVDTNKNHIALHRQCIRDSRYWFHCACIMWYILTSSFLLAADLPSDPWNWVSLRPQPTDINWAALSNKKKININIMTYALYTDDKAQHYHCDEKMEHWVLSIYWHTCNRDMSNVKSNWTNSKNVRAYENENTSWRSWKHTYLKQ